MAADRILAALDRMNQADRDEFVKILGLIPLVPADIQAQARSMMKARVGVKEIVQVLSDAPIRQANS